MQIRGSKSARVGFLFTTSNHTSESSLLLAKVFEISASLHRFVLFWWHIFPFSGVAAGAIYSTCACVNWLTLIIFLFAYSCSHKKKVLDFLDRVCSIYSQKFIPESSVAVDSPQEFIEKVCELAEAYELPPKAYRIAFSDSFVDEMRKYLSQVYNFFIKLCG